MRSINRAIGEPVDQRRLDEAFEQRWPDLASRVQALGPAPQPASPERKGSTRAEEAVPEGTVALPEAQVRILTVLARSPGMQLLADLMPRAIGQNEVRTQYHLDELVSRGFINYHFRAGRRTYVFTREGRAYAVANNLDGG